MPNRAKTDKELRSLIKEMKLGERFEQRVFETLKKNKVASGDSQTVDYRLIITIPEEKDAP